MCVYVITIICMRMWMKCICIIGFCWGHRTFTQWHAALSTNYWMWKNNIKKKTSEWSVQCWHCWPIRQAWISLHIMYCEVPLLSNSHLGTWKKSLERQQQTKILKSLWFHLHVPPWITPHPRGRTLIKEGPTAGDLPFGYLIDGFWAGFLLMVESLKLPWVSNMRRPLIYIIYTPIGP